MSDVIQARAGDGGSLLCEFDGRVLELWFGPSQRYLANELVLQKRKDEKDGGVALFIVPDGSTRLQLSFVPDEVADMEKLVAALTKAGMRAD